jgi:hypothetical protein
MNKKHRSDSNPQMALDGFSSENLKAFARADGVSSANLKAQLARAQTTAAKEIAPATKESSAKVVVDKSS